VSPDASEIQTEGESAVEALYEELLERWNQRDAAGFAALFADDGNLVGFDGSQVDGRAEIESHLCGIFGDHPTASYVAIVREVRRLAPGVAVLRAVVGMVPPGGSDLNPAANAVQTLVAARRDGRWRIALFHNTPAAFHGRPEASEKLTEELRQALRASAAVSTVGGAAR
jgi:uncharacterized protein (TIGR02246 family)